MKDNDKSKGFKRDILNNRENSEGESIYGKFRDRILDQDQKEIVERVQQGAESGYVFDNSDDPLSGEYVRKIDKKVIVMYVVISTIILTSLVIYIYSLIPDAEDKFNKYKSLIAEVEKLNVKKGQKVHEIEKIVNELRENENYKDIEIDPGDDKVLTDQSMQYLSEQASKESNTGIKNKISSIIKSDKELKELQQDIRTKNRSLEAPIVMTKSKGHEQIAFNFLTQQKGLDAIQAKEVIENVNVFDYTYEGLYVWNFYENGFYGSFITKGEADKSPNEIKKLAQQAFQERILDLEREKTALKNITKQLETDLKTSQAKVEELLNQRDKFDDLDIKNKQLKEEMIKKEEMISELNSVRYKLLAYNFAIERGIISDTVWDGVRIEKTVGLDYSSKVDFAVTDNIIIRPKQFSLNSFNEVYVLPKSLVTSGDIKVLKKGQICKIEFINKTNLTQKQILIIAK
ncbi:MAG: hypothetical protein KKD38_09660 [Candidatus Delongbacteria bacterium]|nr:hypothetical protein [Candidatus Delongbacteria bacterium]MCG2760284.1 hypothetical protein [Candidatus Delongbacteria bacterium]